MTLQFGKNESNVENFSDGDRTIANDQFAMVGPTGPVLVRIPVNTGQLQNTTEQDFQVRIGNSENKFFRWSVGGFTYEGDFDTGQGFGLDGSVIPAGVNFAPGPFAGLFSRLRTPDGRRAFPQTIGITRTVQHSWFVTAEVSPIEQLTIRGEYRDTNEKKATNVAFNAISNGPGARGAGRWKYDNYRISVDWKPLDSLLVYASQATGTNAGGFNTSAVPVAPGGVDRDFAFDPEDNTQTEIGAKVNLFGNRVQANLAIFQVDWSNVQLSSPPQNPGALANIIKNIGNVESEGFELELGFRPIDNLTLSAGWSLADAQYTSGAFEFNANAIAACRSQAYCANRFTTVLRTNVTPAVAVPAINLAGLQLPRSSKDKYSLSADGFLPLTGEWEGFGRLDYSWTGPQAGDNINLQKIAARTIVNARLGVRNGKYSVALWGDNLLDDTNATAILQNQATLGSLSTVPGGLPFADAVYPNGRMVGVNLRVNFP